MGAERDSSSTSNPTSTVVTVFVKLPRPGFVKTRLAAGVGSEAAATFYRACAEKTVDVVCRCFFSPTIFLFFPPTSSLFSQLHQRYKIASNQFSCPGVECVICYAPADAGEEIRAWLGERRGSGEVSLFGFGFDFFPLRPFSFFLFFFFFALN
jgi:hypothetical protein